MTATPLDVGRVRVLLATFNGGRWIGGQLDSIGRQTVLPDEIHVFDDGSTDATLDLVNGFAERHVGLVTVHRRPERLGAAANFRAAIEAVTDGIVVLCDQDDLWEPDRLRVALDDLVTVDAVFSDGTLIDGRGEPTGETLWKSVSFSGRRLERWASDPLGVLLRGNVVTGATLAFHRRAIAGFEPLPTRGWHDFTLGVLLVVTGTVRANPRRLIRYRVHGSNAAGLPTKRVRDRQRTLDAHRSMQDDVRAHLDELEEVVRPHNEAAANRLAAKRTYLDRRATLPVPHWRRFGGVARELATGSYHRYGSGFGSAAQDLLAH